MAAADETHVTGSFEAFRKGGSQVELKGKNAIVTGAARGIGPTRVRMMFRR